MNSSNFHSKQSVWILFYATIISLFFGCKQKIGPENLIYNEEKIKAVMIDLYLVAELTKNHEDAMQDSLRKLYGDQIEAIHEVELSKYEEDVAYIKQDDNWFLEIHKVVSDSLEVLDKQQRSKNRKVDDSKKKDQEKKKINTDTKKKKK